ncbi:MAG: hypothetical protein PHW72_01900 [Candidatus Pacebacteria bacterium]|nr:hypothetical protein [Candidatus Paceibacterota bacterium]
MIYFVFIITVVFLIIFLIFFEIFQDKIRISAPLEKYPYLRKKYYLTLAESNLFKTLREAVNDDFYIFPRNRKSVDFVIIGKEYLDPLLAIELDDSSHMFEAGIPLLRINFRNSDNIHELRTLIYGKILNGNRG